MDAPVRPGCATLHRQAVPAETWSWVFGQYLCHDCLTRLSVIESAQTPGAALDLAREVTR